MSEYKIWECMVCSWIYDESKGWPDDNIAPGTRWEDIPEDWTCPECGVSKSDFEMVEVHRTEISAPAHASAVASSRPVCSEEAYQIWECMVCGWIYDEAKGWSEDGIAPGTRWADIPKDWTCPECGVGKEDFEMVAISTATPVAAVAEQIVPAAVEIDQQQPPVVIIGTGLAGYNLAQEFRKLNTTTPLIMISRDDGSYYSKPLLSTGFHKQKTPTDIASASASDMARKLNAEIHIFSTVEAINTQVQSIRLRSGSQERSITYGKLVMATGSSPIEAPLAGNAKGSTYTINDLQDYARFHAASVGKKKILIIGAGLIGSEYANDLIQSGFDLDVVDPLEGVLGNLLPKAVSQKVRQTLEQAGVRFHFGTTVKELNYSPEGIRATLSNGQEITTELVISAIGVRPQVQLATEAGLTVNRGIVTNRLLETSASNVYALGDCAEVDSHVLYYITPMLACARVLATTLNGSPTAVAYSAMPVTIKTTLCPLVVSPPPRDCNGEWRTQDHGENGVEALFYAANGALAGLALCGNRISEAKSFAEQLPPLMQN